MLIYKYLYIIFIGLLIASCSESPFPPPAPNNDWQKMGLKGRVKYCFIKVFKNDSSTYNSALSDTIYHFSLDGRLILSKKATPSDGAGCGSHMLISYMQMILCKYKYYPDGTKAVFCYMEYYNRSLALLDSWLYDVEIHYPKAHSLKIHHVREKKIETYDSLKRIRTYQHFAFYRNHLDIHDRYIEYDSSMQVSFLKEHFWGPNHLHKKLFKYNVDGYSDSCYLEIGNLHRFTKLKGKKILSDGSQAYIYATFNYRDSIPDISVFVPHISTDTYKYDKYGNWTERILRYGGHIERKIEYW